MLPGRHDELQSAATEYEVLDFTPLPATLGGGLSTVAFRPLTGRTHQIRRHAAQELERPILGDTRYGSPESTGVIAVGAGLFLSAVELEVPSASGASPTVHVVEKEPAKFHEARCQAAQHMRAEADEAEVEDSVGTEAVGSGGADTAELKHATQSSA